MNRLGPLTGVLFLVILIVSFVIGGEPPDVEEPVQEIVDFYVDDKDAIQVGAVLGGLAAVLLVFFGAYLRKVLRAAEGEGGWLSALPLIGVTIIAMGAALDATISFALAESADNIEPTAVQALQALWDNDWLPFAVGIEIFLLSVGISILKYGALPKWLGWVAIALAVVGLTPIGFAAFAGSAVFVLIVSILLTIRAGDTATA